MLKKKIQDFENLAIEAQFARQVINSLRNNRLFIKLINEFERIYAKKLFDEIKKHEVPHHIAIIMDGNRRYASNRGLPTYQGHLKGKDKLKDVVKWCNDLDIKILTVFAFSTDNFSRSEEEVTRLMSLFEQDLNSLAKDKRTDENEINIKVIGELDLLPKNVQKAAKNIMEKTDGYSKYYCNIAIGYGGREEIVEAIKHISKDVQKGKMKPGDIDKDVLSSYLYTAHLPFPDPDLVLRTSGEERISNFLLWQLAYSELYFSDVFWPSFKHIDFLKAIKSYQQRQKRYGK